MFDLDGPVPISNVVYTFRQTSTTTDRQDRRLFDNYRSILVQWTFSS